MNEEECRELHRFYPRATSAREAGERYVDYVDRGIAALEAALAHEHARWLATHGITRKPWRDP